MKIKKYSCKRFAGNKGVSLEFKDGINVLYGPNEAGKSTVVDGIWSVLFKSTKLDNRSVEDKNFKSRYMPVSSGDSIDGELVLSTDKGAVTLSREWGAAPSVQLVLSNGDMLKNEEKIDAVLKDVLVFGEGTYSSILFSRQRELRESLSVLRGNAGMTDEVGSLLRKAIMELDGISIDDLSIKINAKKDALLKKWDVARNCPEGNRGISNPYKVDFGEILGHYYKKENLRIAQSEAETKQKRFDEISRQLKEHETLLSALKAKIDSMGKIENDVVSRSILEPKLEGYLRERARLSTINSSWIEKELRLTQLEAEYRELQEALKKLQEEEALASKGKEKAELTAKLDGIRKIEEQIRDLDEKLGQEKKVTKKDVADLEESERSLLTKEAQMKAGVMLGRLVRYSGGTELLLTRDLEEATPLSEGVNFQANGYLRIESRGLLEIELKSGDIDVEGIRKEYQQGKKKLEDALAALGVTGIDEARRCQSRVEVLETQKGNLKSKLEGQLGGDTAEGLQQKLDAIGDLSNVRSIDTIRTEIAALNDKKIERVSEGKSARSAVDDWKKEFTDQDGLLDKMADVKAQQKQDQAALDKLAPLPDGYGSAEAFRQELADSRNRYGEAGKKKDELIKEYYESENGLSVDSPEELKAQAEQEERLFAEKLQEGKRLLKVKEAFDKTRQDMDKNSFAPVADSFTKYLKLLTDDKFQSAGIDHTFSLKLVKDAQNTLPADLLSAGTYDTVALALKLAIFEHILGEKEGMLVLDDCFVDLDPARKEHAATLLQEFSKKHQVIFTTCDPATADLLGGNRIGM